jgi:hypothetical protein
MCYLGGKCAKADYKERHGSEGRGVTYKSCSRFITSFSMPSIALSNSASETDFQTSVSRIFCEMNYILIG